jgi:uncharacterized protein YggT (Ycf19 family)
LSLIDFILNVVGLLLWLNWRAAEAPLGARPGTSLLVTLRPAGPPRPGYYYWGGLPVLLVLRALFYWQAGPPVQWTPRLALGPTTLVFRCDLAGRMMLYSVLSFGVALGVFYLWLLFLSCLNAQVPNADAVQRLARVWLGRLERWPGPVKLLLPVAAPAVFWCLLHPLLAWLNMAPSSSVGQLLAQGAVIGLAACLTLKFLLLALLILHLFNSYVYVGEFPLWSFVDATVRRLLRPMRKLPLRAGKIDLAPVLCMVLVLLAAEYAQRGLALIYQGL